MNRFSRGLGLVLWLAVGTVTHAQTTWDAQDYDLYMGDFNGDGKTDVLYVAKSANGISGINLSDGNGPNIPLESWSSNYLGINWSANQYTVIVADFNGDGKADVLLQSSTPGNSYLLFANAQGMLTGISQTIAENTAGLAWSADQHRLVAGDFNHDGLADLFFQATSSSGINAVMLASATGQFTETAPVQSWSDGFLGFKWSTTESLVYAANFDGINGDDLLIQARPVFVLINYDVPFPVPTFPPNTDGVVLAQAAAPFFQIAGVQAWNSNSFGVNWSPLVSNIIVGDFNGNGRAGVILQGKHTGQASDLLDTNSSGAVFGSGVLLSSSVTWTADSYRLLVGQFSGAGNEGIYFQALTPGGTNVYASTVIGSTVPVTSQTPVVASNIVQYSYDELGRLITVTYSGAANNSVQASYTYDKAGNRTNVSVTGAAN